MAGCAARTAPKTQTCFGRCAAAQATSASSPRSNFCSTTSALRWWPGLLVHPLENAPTILNEYRSLVAAAPDELSCWIVLRKAPPAPFIPAEWHDRHVLIMALCHCGSIKAGEAAAAAYRALGKPIVDLVGPHDFVAWQTAFDPLLAPGARNYWKSHDLAERSDPAVALLLDAVRELPTSECEVFVGHFGGQISRIDDSATDFSRRDANFVVNLHTRWRDPAEDAACVGWARSLFEALSPYATGAVYVIFMPGDEADRIRSAFGANYDRLVAVKKRYDLDSEYPHELKGNSGAPRSWLASIQPASPRTRRSTPATPLRRAPAPFPIARAARRAAPLSLVPWRSCRGGPAFRRRAR
jgi:hypothetical protein